MQNQPNAQNQINQARPSFFSRITNYFLRCFETNRNNTRNNDWLNREVHGVGSVNSNATKGSYPLRHNRCHPELVEG